MELLYKNIIIFVAIIIGSILLFFGITELNIKNGRKGGLFLLTLLLVMTFSNCVNSQTFTPNKTSIIQQSDRIIELNKSLEWQYFKAFWQSLDNVIPNTTVNINNKSIELFQSYNFNFNNDEDNFNKNIDELKKHLKILKQANIFSDTELLALETICRERITFLFTFNPMLVSHMISSQISINFNNSLESLENKIDILVQLEENDIISLDEYQKSLEIINNQIQNILIISTIATNYNIEFYEGNQIDKNTLEINKQYFENHFAKLIKNEGKAGNSQKKYLEITEKIKEIEQSFDSFDDIINDLLANKNSRIIVFEKTDAFKEFKQLWFKIDTLNQNESSNNTNKRYQENQNLYNELGEIIKKIRNTNLFSDVETRLLYSLTNKRIEFLIGLNPYVRSVRPTTFSLNSALMLEDKIDVLSNLKSQNLIDQKEYDKALLEVFNFSDQLLISSFFYTYNFFAFDFPKKSDDAIESFLKTLEHNYLELISENPDRKETLTINYKKSLDYVNQIKTAMPTIHKLIERLEK